MVETEQEVLSNFISGNIFEGLVLLKFVVHFSNILVNELASIEHSLNLWKRILQVDALSISPANIFAHLLPTVFIKVLLNFWKRRLGDGFDVSVDITLKAISSDRPVHAVLIIKG